MTPDPKNPITSTTILANLGSILGAWLIPGLDQLIAKYPEETLTIYGVVNILIRYVFTKRPLSFSAKV